MSQIPLDLPVKRWPLQCSKLCLFSSPRQVQKYLVTKILAKVANQGDVQIKEKLTWKIVNNRTNLINSTSGGITCVSLFPSRGLESWILKLKMSCSSKLANLIDLKGFCAPWQCYPVLAALWCWNKSFFVTWQSIPSLSYCGKVKCWKRAGLLVIIMSWSVHPSSVFLWRPFCNRRLPKGDFWKNWAWSAASWGGRHLHVIWHLIFLVDLWNFYFQNMLIVA